MWIEGRLPLVNGMKAQAAVDALAAPAGPDDERTYGQRMADGLVELADRARSGAGLPPQRGVPVELMAVVPVDALEGRADVPAGTLTGGPGGGIDLSHSELADIVKQADLSWLIVDLDGATDVTTQALVCDTDHERRHKGGWTLSLDPDGTATATSPDGSTVLTETAVQRRGRHGTWELSTTRDDVAHGTPATYRTPADRVRDPPELATGTVQRPPPTTAPDDRPTRVRRRRPSRTVP